MEVEKVTEHILEHLGEKILNKSHCQDLEEVILNLKKENAEKENDTNYDTCNICETQFFSEKQRFNPNFEKAFAIIEKSQIKKLNFLLSIS